MRLGFAEPTVAAVELEQLGLWSDGEPADGLVAALAEAPDPDLATRALVRLSAATGDSAELLERLRTHDGLRRDRKSVV